MAEKLIANLVQGADGVRVDSPLLDGEVTDASVSPTLTNDQKEDFRNKIGVEDELPDTSGLSASDNGDILVFKEGEGWIRGGFADGTRTRFVFVDASDNVRFDWLAPNGFENVDWKKLLEILTAFLDGGWESSSEAEVSSTIKFGTSRHTASELTALSYSGSRTNPSPNAGAGFLGFRVRLYRKSDADDGKFRATEANFSDPDDIRYSQNYLTSTSNYVTSDNDWAYYSIAFPRFIADEMLRPEELDPFGLDPKYVEKQIADVFDQQSWATTEGEYLFRGSSTLPYGEHNNNIRTLSGTWGSTHAVGSTSGGFNLAVRIPVGDKDALEHFRLTSSVDSSIHAITPGQHVVDDATYAYYNVNFPASGATTITLQERTGHLFNPKKGRIRWYQLEDTPNSYTGQAGKIPRVKSDETGLELTDDQVGPTYTGGTGIEITNSNVINVSATHVRGTNVLGDAVVNIVNQNFLTSFAQSVTPTLPWNIPEQGQFNLRTNVGNGLRSLDFQFFAEDLRAVPAVTAAGATNTAGSSLDFEISDGVYLRLYRTPQNTIHFRTSADASNVDILIQPITTTGLTEFASSSVTPATYEQIAASVSLPVGGVGNYDFGSYQEIYRYTATEDDEHWIVGAHFEMQPDWSAALGDRGYARIRMRKMSAANQTISVLLHPSTHYLRNIHTNVKDAGFEEVTPVDLDTGEYLLLEGSASRQGAGAGNIIVNHLLTNFWRIPREVPAVVAAPPAEQVVGSTSNREFRRWRRAPINTTPTLPLGFDGVVWTGASGWNEYPITGTTPAGEQVYHGQGEAVYNPLATFDWTVRNVSVTPADRVRFSSVRNPYSADQITSSPTSTTAWINYYITGVGWSPIWYNIGQENIWRYLDRVNWYPDSSGSSANIDFPQLDAAQIGGAAIIFRNYTSQGTAPTEEIRFQLVPMPNIVSVARGTITQAETNGGILSWSRQNGSWIELSDFNNNLQHNQANHGAMRCNFQWQSRTPGGTLIDRLAFKGPGYYQASRSIRWEFELEVMRL